MNLDKIEENLGKLEVKLNNYQKQLIVFFKMVFFSTLKYLFLAWIYFGIYAFFGWERTVIVMFISVMIFNLNSHFDFAGLRAENDELRRIINENKEKNGD
jgi:hypothetical protein